jgi:hypothetical protein
MATIANTTPFPRLLSSALHQHAENEDRTRLDKYITTVKEKLRNHPQLLCRAISPKDRPSTILTIKTDTLSRRSQRRLILYRLGSIPGHPYKTCQKCLFLTGDEIDCNRKHTTECLSLTDALSPLITAHQPTNLNYNPDTNLTIFDNFLETIDAASKHPQKPPSSAPPEARDRWKQRCEEIDQTVAQLWQHAGHTIDDICKCLVGWEGDRMFTQDEPLVIDHNDFID